jgi:hypothetical protein
LLRVRFATFLHRPVVIGPEVIVLFPVLAQGLLIVVKGRSLVPLKAYVLLVPVSISVDSFRLSRRQEIFRFHCATLALLNAASAVPAPTAISTEAGDLPTALVSTAAAACGTSTTVRRIVLIHRVAVSSMLT